MMGLRYDDLLDRDLRFYINCLNGFIKKREYLMNDMQSIGHRIAGKIAQAVWGDKKFTNELDIIEFNKIGENKPKVPKYIQRLRKKGYSV